MRNAGCAKSQPKSTTPSSTPRPSNPGFGPNGPVTGCRLPPQMLLKSLRTRSHCHQGPVQRRAHGGKWPEPPSVAGQGGKQVQHPPQARPEQSGMEIRNDANSRPSRQVAGAPGARDVAGDSVHGISNCRVGRQPRQVAGFGLSNQRKLAAVHHRDMLQGLSWQVPGWPMAASCRRGN